MIEPTLWFWIGALGMSLGTIVFSWGWYTTSEYKRYYAILSVISFIAAVAYIVMAFRIGWVEVGDRLVFVPRYIDWILTTPLLLLFLGLLAGSDRRELGTVVGINTIVMVCGFVAALLSGVARFGLFALAAVAYLGLLFFVLGPMTARANERGSSVGSLFTSLRNLTVVLWSIYPVIWILGPPGLDLLTLTVDVMLITYLDLLTKVGFGLIALKTSTVVGSELDTLTSQERSAAS
ncbi:bacteriorhodopsin [Natrialbaceae archaeon A-arb3/5]